MPPDTAPPSRPPSGNALPIGTHVADFEITGLIGEGGFGIVYEVFDHSLHRRAALKEYMPTALANRRGDYTVAVRSEHHEPTFRAGLKSFVNEARLLAQFDHPALVKVFRFWEQNDTAYMAMPLYEGSTLKDVLRANPRPDEGWLRAIIAPLLDALELMHAARCYHRDVSPDNILILKSGAPLLLDFGAARRIIGDMTQAVTVILKPGYAPIEQYADDASMQQGPWTDIYALSAVFCLAVTGKPPATSVTRMVSDPMKPLADTVDGYSEEFLSALDRGLGVRPEQRPQSIAEFRALLGIRTAAPPVSQIRMQRAAARAAATPDENRTARMPPPASGVGAAPAPKAPASAVAALAEASRPRSSRSGRSALIVAGVATLVAAGVMYALLRGDTPPAPHTSTPAPALAPSAPPAVAPAPAAVAAPTPPVVAAPAPPVAKPPAVAPTAAAPPAGPEAGNDLAIAPPDKAPEPAVVAKGRVNLAVKPWGGIYVNGQPQGVTPPKKWLELPEGKYNIEIRNTGFPSHFRDVEVKAGRPVTVTHTFQ